MNLWDLMVSIFWFMLLVAWFWLLISIISDLFRDDELSGVAKAGWCIFVILIPWLGVLTYLLVRGRSMGERASREAARNEKAFRSYVRDAASTGGGVADELGRLTTMRDSGQITPEEYELAKQRVLGIAPTATATDSTPTNSAGTLPTNLPA
jgi:hypothetical protein